MAKLETHETHSVRDNDDGTSVRTAITEGSKKQRQLHAFGSRSELPFLSDIYGTFVHRSLYAVVCTAGRSITRISSTILLVVDNTRTNRPRTTAWQCAWMPRIDGPCRDLKGTLSVSARIRVCTRAIKTTVACIRPFCLRHDNRF